MYWGWLQVQCILASYNALWVYVAGVNSHCFLLATDSPLHNLPLWLCKEETVKESMAFLQCLMASVSLNWKQYPIAWLSWFPPPWCDRVRQDRWGGAEAIRVLSLRGKEASMAGGSGKMDRMLHLWRLFLWMKMWKYPESFVMICSWYLLAYCSELWCHMAWHQYTRLVIDILKMESWMHMGHTANIIVKDIIHIFASISKNMYFRAIVVSLDSE